MISEKEMERAWKKKTICPNFTYPNLSYYRDICLQALRKTKKYPRQDSWTSIQDFKSIPHEYEAEAIGR
jgi:hypothetical protein